MTVGSARDSAVCTSAVARPRARASATKSSPFASSRNASSQPSVAPCTNGWSTPSTYGSAAGGGPGDSSGSATSQAVGGGTRGSPPGQRQRQLQIGVDPGHDPAQQLQDERISVDDRRIRLLGGHQARHQTGPDLLARVPFEAEPADPGLGAQGLQEQFGGPGVVQGLVDRTSGQRAPGDMTDQRGREPGRQRLAHAYEQLIAVARLLGAAVPRLKRLMGADEEVVQAELGGGRQQLGRRDQGEPGDRAALAREPALPRQPLLSSGSSDARRPGGVVTVRVTASDMASRPSLFRHATGASPVGGVLLMRAPGGAGKPPRPGFYAASFRSRNQ
ncbi:hypothetical protein SHKM778_18050 [Streptomyces sp. KM77-8]|uniref:Uncharacterized protein n=1 Tax=Streptomyces haneummycinicus TaxID=3074435 RepID=A0AAT9HDA9_9ACTN